jgi:hypothetical protein
MLGGVTPSDRPVEIEPCFAGVPTWVRTFYWTPICGRFARAWILRHGAFRPVEPGEPGNGFDDEAGVREPRRPKPSAGAGCVQLEEPFSTTSAA